MADRRRFLLTALAGALAAPLAPSPLVADPQQAGKIYRVGLILSTSPAVEMVGPDPARPFTRAFVAEELVSSFGPGQASTT